MFKPSLHLRLSASIGQLAVNPSLIGLFLETVDDPCWNTLLFDEKKAMFNANRKSMRSYGDQLSSYLSWFDLYRLAKDVKQ